jgi:hypothetical protein
MEQNIDVINVSDVRNNISWSIVILHAANPIVLCVYGIDMELNKYLHKEIKLGNALIVIKIVTVLLA